MLLSGDDHQFGERGGPAASHTKRLMDVAGAIVGLLLFGFPMLAIAVLIRLRLGSPVLFRQIRLGLHGSRSPFASSAPCSTPSEPMADRYGRKSPHDR